MARMGATSRMTTSSPFFSLAASATASARWTASGWAARASARVIGDGVKPRATRSSLPLSIEPVFVDEAHGSRRHQAVDRPSGGDASSDLGGGDIKTRDRHPLEAPLRPGWYRVLTGTLHDHHGAERTGVVEPAPSSHV